MERSREDDELGCLGRLVRRLIDGFWWLAVTLRLLLHLGWLRLNSWAVRAFVGTRLTSSLGDTPVVRKVLILGDGNAEGVGDWVTMGSTGGVQRRLARLLREEERLKTRWEVVTRGQLGSTSHEWTPECTRKPIFSKVGVQKTLWKDVTTSAACRDADVVVLMLGSMDGARHSTVKSPEETATNVGRIIDGLRSWNNVNVVVIVPCAPAIPNHKQRNLAVLKYIADDAERRRASSGGGGGAEESKGDGSAQVRDKRSRKRPEGDELKIVTLPVVGSRAFEDPSLFCFDGFHFSSVGYDRVARAVASSLAIDHMVRVEFKYIDAALAPTN